MSREVPVEYYVSYGRLGGSERCQSEMYLNDKETKAYIYALIMGGDLADIPELDRVYEKTCEDIICFEQDEYDNDPESEGCVCLDFAESYEDLSYEDILIAMRDAVKCQDAEYLQAIFETFQDDYGDKLWEGLVSNVSVRRKPVIKEEADEE